jgi:hypothetical protein
MNVGDIQQKLALLPDGLAEENVLSWQHVAKLFGAFTRYEESPYNPLYDLIQAICKSEQAKLFRAGMSAPALMISTKEKHGLEKGDAFIWLGLKDNNNLYIGYSANTDEVFVCKNDDVLSMLLPLLDRLWNETRGKKNG